MKLTIHRFELPLRHTFTISRDSTDIQRSVVVQLKHEGLDGWGEVTENAFYGQSVDVIEADFEKSRSFVERFSDQDWSPASVSEFWQSLVEVLSPSAFALAALDMAFVDLCAKQAGLPTYRFLDLTWKLIPPSSFTIGIDTIETMIRKLDAAPGWPVYKIKLGTEDDIDIIKRLRQATPATFRVDANGGWTANQTIENSLRLAELGVQFIEQPLPVSASDDDKRKCFSESLLPIIADEDCQVPEDIGRAVGRYHGVNVKLCKCGGLTPAVKMLQEAKRLELKTMVGCMVESSIGISAAAQLLPLLDYADLDGALLLWRDPAKGVSINRGSVAMPIDPGNGARLTN